jgi:hypothetical protein
MSGLDPIFFCNAIGGFWPIASISQFGPCPLLANADAASAAYPCCWSRPDTSGILPERGAGAHESCFECLDDSEREIAADQLRVPCYGCGRLMCALVTPFQGATCSKACDARAAPSPAEATAAADVGMRAVPSQIYSRPQRHWRSDGEILFDALSLESELRSENGTGEQEASPLSPSCFDSGSVGVWCLTIRRGAFRSS